MVRPQPTAAQLPIVVVGTLAFFVLVGVGFVAILATSACGCGGSSADRNAAELRVIGMAVESYHKLYGTWPVTASAAPRESAGDPFQLNRELLANLRRDWGRGNFDGFSSRCLGQGATAGLLVDGWGRPLVVTAPGPAANNARAPRGPWIYSAGEDGLDDPEDLRGWLSRGLNFPPGAAYQQHLNQTRPDSPNIDNVYPPEW